MVQTPECKFILCILSSEEKIFSALPKIRYPISNATTVMELREMLDIFQTQFRYLSQLEIECLLNIGILIGSSFWQWLHDRANFIMQCAAFKHLCITHELVHFLSREKCESILENYPIGTAIFRFACTPPTASNSIITISLVTSEVRFAIVSKNSKDMS